MALLSFGCLLLCVYNLLGQTTMVCFTFSEGKYPTTMAAAMHPEGTSCRASWPYAGNSQGEEIGNAADTNSARSILRLKFVDFRLESDHGSVSTFKTTMSHCVL
ncbi:hypothetical protein CMV_025201 [Castanea mollissima]|uniref:Secreted protein n=1 Tax=Castanea mollissima TaxID=60419 RepID=A0A8J4VH62_9ROSI|nr:hypothetical protein CMV_025201 [Castanea mollissima]